MPFAQLDALKLYYRMRGKGARLLFITGTASDLRQGLTVFESDLVRHFTVLTLDQRGIGQSNSPVAKPTMQDYARDIKKLLDYVGWKKCYVIGESFGGMVAQEFALRYPQYVEKCVLAVTSSGGKGGSSFPFHQHDMSQMTPQEKAAFFVKCCDTRMKDPKWKTKNKRLYQEQYKTYLEVFKLATKNPHRGLYSQRQIAARKGHNTYSRLSQLKMPVYLVAGRYDNVAPIKNQLALLSKIPQAKLSIFNGSHLVLWQDPLAFESIINFFKKIKN